MDNLTGYYIRNPRGCYLSRPHGPAGDDLWIYDWTRATVFPPETALAVCWEAWQEGEEALAMIPVFETVART